MNPVLKEALEKAERDLRRVEARQVPPNQNHTGGDVHHKIEFPFSKKNTAFGTEERAYRAGAWFAATMLGNPIAKRRCDEHGIEWRAALAESDNSLGGALVPNEFSQAIIDLREEYGVFRANTRVVPMTSETLTIPRVASGSTAYYVGENSEVPESNMTFNSVNLTARKLAVLQKMSTEIAEDAFVDVADQMARDAALQLAIQEDLAGFIGDGTSTYGGIFGIAKRLDDGNGDGAATLKGSVYAASGHDTFAEVDVTDLTTVMAQLPQYARRNAKWYCSQVAQDLIFSRLALAAGGNTAANLAGGLAQQFGGYPIVVSSVLEDATTTIDNSHMVLFGDLTLSSTMGSRRDIRVQRLAERWAEYDQVGVLVTERFDIVNHDYGTSTVAGPMVALIGQTS